jgi:cysteine synthase
MAIEKRTLNHNLAELKRDRLKYFIRKEESKDVSEQNNVYFGEDALAQYLCPDNYLSTPLVELPADLNPFKNNGVRLFAKIMSVLPLMNIKSLPAYSMLHQAAERGDLEGVKCIVESSSANTVLCLSVLGRLFGIERTSAVVGHSISPALSNMLRLFDIEVHLHPASGHKYFDLMPGRSQRAKELGKQPGFFNPGQYSNPDNPRGFAQWLAPDLWKQTQGRLNMLSCSMGTCGTMVGLSRVLRNYNPSMYIVGCCSAPGNVIPGPRELSLINDVSFDWQNIANVQTEVSAEESFAASVKLLRRGIMGGPSSGMNYAGVLKHLHQLVDTGELECQKNDEGELWCAFLCCDSPLQHIQDYYKVLPEEYFPPVHEVPEPGKKTDCNQSGYNYQND